MLQSSSFARHVLGNRAYAAQVKSLAYLSPVPQGSLACSLLQAAAAAPDQHMCNISVMQLYATARNCMELYAAGCNCMQEYLVQQLAEMHQARSLR